MRRPAGGRTPRSAAPPRCASADTMARSGRSAARPGAATVVRPRAFGLTPGRGHPGATRRQDGWPLLFAPVGPPQRDARQRPPLGALRAPRWALTRVRLPTATTKKRWRVGSSAVHPQYGARSRRRIASASLRSPALRARSTVDHASSGRCATWRAPRPYADKARRCSAASRRQVRTVFTSTAKPRAVARSPRPAAPHAKTGTISSTAACWPWTSVPWVSTKAPGHDGQYHCRQGPPRGGPVARRWPRPRPPQSSPSRCGQQCLEGSTARGRQFVEGMGPGRTGGGAWGGAVSRSPRAPWGFWVRPSKGVGSLERWRWGVRDSGWAGVAGAVTVRGGQVRCRMLQNHTRAHRSS